MKTPLVTPASAAAEQVRRAVGGRASSDYVFRFWSAFGWTVLTLGLYSFYVFYQLMRRSRDHNRRRAALLAAAHDLARQRAVEQGNADSLRPAFDQVHAEVQQLRGMDNDFRDPAIWLLLSIVGGGLAWLGEAILLDQDLVRHERHERAAEARLTDLFAQLGVMLPAPAPAAKQPHNYVGRIVAVVLTFGLYSLWWVADLMHEGNANYQQDAAWEDAIAEVAASAASNVS